MISVVIPTHNRPEELKRAIKSVFNQTKLPNELIVVDDASYPKLSNDIFCDSPQNISCKLISIEQSKGGNHARNIGIDNSRTEYIALLDDDDIFEFNKIELIFNIIKKSNNVDLFYHKARIFMVNENYSYLTKPEIIQDHQQLLNRLLIKNIIGGTPMVIFKKESFIKSGKFDISIPALQDYELWIRFAKNNFSFLYVDKVLTSCFYTTKKKSISKSIEAHNIAISYIEKKYHNEFKNLNPLSMIEYEEWKARVLIHKYLLNEQKYQALKFTLLSYKKTFKIKYLGFALVIIGGNRIIKLLKKFQF